MEQSSQPNVEKSALESQIRECFGRVVYATKTHEKDADLCMQWLARVKLAQIVLSALTTGGLVTVLVGEHDTSQIAAIVSAVISTALLVLNAYVKDVDPGQQAEQHKKTATELWNIRESYLSILTDLQAIEIDMDLVRKTRDELQTELAGIYSSAPRTTPKAYKHASQGLKMREEMTFSDEEIDKFLPETLRKVAR
ncbi:SLATT domain-containing protein [Sulfuriflexus sp.]|uniref:SLATT domain-containing protein n=1 Tax=Sulfuriflexus sp. TaxID=2015443 RepID=UPI0028CC16CD|nr:SLATT domain-containing protein [Sulfuriflexus sp.]MDT8405324.1 SLATT domain-containing protein [Sulfuriflexus sp.]